MFESCGCGGPYERALRMVTGAIMEGEACAVLEHAARRWLDSHSDDDLDALEGALAQWLTERSRFDGRGEGCGSDSGNVGAHSPGGGHGRRGNR